MRLQVQIEFRIETVSKENCDRYDKPYGTLQLVDDDGFRISFAKDEQAARDDLHDYIGGSMFDSFEVVNVT